MPAMSRKKMGLIAGAVMVALTAAAYVLVVGSVRSKVDADLETRVDRALQMLTKNESLEALDFIDTARRLSSDPALVPALTEADPAAREAKRTAVLKSLAEHVENHHLAFIAVLDATGKLAMSDSPVPVDDWRAKYPTVAAVIDRRIVAKDVWTVGKAPVEVVLAGIYDERGLQGVLVLGEVLDAERARGQAALVGTEVVYYTGDRLTGVSFQQPGVLDDLSAVPELRKLATDVLSAGSHDGVRVTLGGTPYLAKAVALPLSFGDKTSGAIVLGNLAAARETVASVGPAILIFGGLALVVVLLVMVATARSLISQVEEIELGVGDIINGNVDFIFNPVGADFDGLANALNVLLARMLGRPEPDADADVDADGKPGKPEQLDAGGASVAEIQKLAAEPEDAYYARIFGEYVAAREKTGEGAAGATLEGFTTKLRITEANLKKKHACNAVRFRVVVKDNQVTLKPVPIA
jgi:hypothetical protein